MTATAELGQKVQKCGRTTGCTTGQIEEINITINVCYQLQGPFFCKKLAKFVDQIGITPGEFSAGGDSGSLIVTNDGNNSPVALLFAGSSNRTLGNPINKVLQEFGVTIDDGSGSEVIEKTDIAVTTVEAPASATAGDTVRVDVTLYNLGNKDVTGDILVILRDDTDGIAIGQQTVAGGLNAGTSVRLTYSWNSGAVSLGDHTLTASQSYVDDDKSNDSGSTIVNIAEVSADPIDLTVTGYKVKGLQKADLSWSGATSTNVNVYRNGAYVATTANDGSDTNDIDNRGGGSYTYQVCEAGTSTCSNEATVTF